MSPTIEQLARECALRISAREEACKRDPMNVCLYPTLEELLVSFLSAVHAGPLKGVGEALENSEEVLSERNPTHAHYCTAALALLQSIQQPRAKAPSAGSYPAPAHSCRPDHSPPVPVGPPG